MDVINTMANNNRAQLTFNADATDLSCVDAQAFSVVILAAGLSRRMGTVNKLMLDVGDESLLRHCVSVVSELNACQTIVVLGHQQKIIESEIADLGVQLIVNENFSSGQQSSVLCGLKAVSENNKATLICLSDQPLLNASHFYQLMWAFDNRPEGLHIVVPVHESKRGNPVLISEMVRQQVLNSSHLDCRRYLNENPDKVFWVSFNDAAYVTDVDTPEEYAALQNL